MIGVRGYSAKTSAAARHFHANTQAPDHQESRFKRDNGPMHASTYGDLLVMPQPLLPAIEPSAHSAQQQACRPLPRQVPLRHKHYLTRFGHCPDVSA
jgi:hypothetical protein